MKIDLERANVQAAMKKALSKPHDVTTSGAMLLRKGDVPGHEFHGNQYTGGGGGGDGEFKGKDGIVYDNKAQYNTAVEMRGHVMAAAGGDTKAAQSYINEAEHQDGPGYWEQFSSKEEVAADYKLYRENMKDPSGSSGKTPASDKLISRFDRSTGNFADNLREHDVQDIMSAHGLSQSEAQRVFDHVQSKTRPGK